MTYVLKYTKNGRSEELNLLISFLLAIENLRVRRLFVELDLGCSE